MVQHRVRARMSPPRAGAGSRAQRHQPVEWRPSGGMEGGVKVDPLRVERLACEYRSDLLESFSSKSAASRSPRYSVSPRGGRRVVIVPPEEVRLYGALPYSRVSGAAGSSSSYPATPPAVAWEGAPRAPLPRANSPAADRMRGFEVLSISEDGSVARDARDPPPASFGAPPRHLREGLSARAAAFLMFDTDGSGKIPTCILGQAFAAAGFKKKAVEKATASVEEARKTGSVQSSISQSEFERMCDMLEGG
eukprot:Hpha_TRINITY_DN15498_c2_g1::TRINITY_DN15498_c2_g1_i1::g.173048::m.173048